MMKEPDYILYPNMHPVHHALLTIFYVFILIQNCDIPWASLVDWLPLNGHTDLIRTGILGCTLYSLHIYNEGGFSVTTAAP